jgi:hypothetical protein
MPKQVARVQMDVALILALVLVSLFAVHRLVNA